MSFYYNKRYDIIISENYNFSITGYAGGIKRKKYLLEHEKVDMSNLFVPTKGTAL